MNLSRWFYKRAMLRAIKDAAGRESMTDGLRVIRRFERVNGCVFDPGDPAHRQATFDCGCHENLFRRLNYVSASRQGQEVIA